MDKQFDRIYKEYSSMVYRIGILFFKSAHFAEDVVQDCFLKLFTTSPNITDERHLKGWLIVTARNICRNLIKKNSRIVPLDENIPFFDKDNDVLRAIMTLKEKDRTVVYLHYYEGFTTKEIAAAMRATDGAIRARLKRARLQLKNYLEE